jgi:hypothetical protein
MLVKHAKLLCKACFDKENGGNLAYLRAEA